MAGSPRRASTIMPRSSGLPARVTVRARSPGRSGFRPGITSGCCFRPNGRHTLVRDRLGRDIRLNLRICFASIPRSGRGVAQRRESCPPPPGLRPKYQLPEPCEANPFRRPARWLSGQGPAPPYCRSRRLPHVPRPTPGPLRTGSVRAAAQANLGLHPPPWLWRKAESESLRPGFRVPPRHRLGHRPDGRHPCLPAQVPHRQQQQSGLTPFHGRVRVRLIRGNHFDCFQR